MSTYLMVFKNQEFITPAIMNNYSDSIYNMIGAFTEGSTPLILNGAKVSISGSNATINSGWFRANNISTADLTNIPVIFSCSSNTITFSNNNYIVARYTIQQQVQGYYELVTGSYVATSTPLSTDIILCKIVNGSIVEENTSSNNLALMFPNISYKVVSPSNNYQMSDNDFLIMYYANQDITITLPQNAQSLVGLKYTIVNNTHSNTVHVNSNQGFSNIQGNSYVLKYTTSVSATFNGERYALYFSQDAIDLLSSGYPLNRQIKIYNAASNTSNIGGIETLLNTSGSDTESIMRLNLASLDNTDKVDTILSPMPDVIDRLKIGMYLYAVKNNSPLPKTLVGMSIYEDRLSIPNANSYDRLTPVSVLVKGDQISYSGTSSTNDINYNIQALGSLEYNKTTQIVEFHGIVSISAINTTTSDINGNFGLLIDSDALENSTAMATNGLLNRFIIYGTTVQSGTCNIQYINNQFIFNVTNNNNGLTWGVGDELSFQGFLS